MIWGPNGIVKRILDLLFAITALLALSPLLFTIARLILIDDGWPVFYIHQRVGKGGKLFPFFKFRTMVKNADKIGAGYEVDAGDKRVLRTGEWLRRWSLDEVPQLLNILRGEMSLIGPRPTLAYQVETYTERQHRRHEVRPGLTGLAQVRGRNSLSWPQRIEYDIEYIDTYSLALDLQIVLRTFSVILKPDGIYGQGWAKQEGDPGYTGDKETK